MHLFRLDKRDPTYYKFPHPWDIQGGVSETLLFLRPPGVLYNRVSFRDLFASPK